MGTAIRRQSARKRIHLPGRGLGSPNGDGLQAGGPRNAPGTLQTPQRTRQARALASPPSPLHVAWQGNDAARRQNHTEMREVNPRCDVQGKAAGSALAYGRSFSGPLVTRCLNVACLVGRLSDSATHLGTCIASMRRGHHASLCRTAHTCLKRLINAACCRRQGWLHMYPAAESSTTSHVSKPETNQLQTIYRYSWPVHPVVNIRGRDRP
jgi:hypothetical protein